jgi:hypothetical protein
MMRKMILFAEFTFPVCFFSVDFSVASKQQQQQQHDKNTEGQISGQGQSK